MRSIKLCLNFISNGPVPRATKLLLLFSCFYGMAWVAVELSIVFIFKGFFYALDTSVGVKGFFSPSLNEYYLYSALLLVAGTMRSFLFGMQNYISQKTQMSMVTHLKTKIFEIIFLKKFRFKDDELINFFNGEVSGAGEFIQNFSLFILHLTVTFFILIFGFILIPYYFLFSSFMLLIVSGAYYLKTRSDARTSEKLLEIAQILTRSIHYTLNNIKLIEVYGLSSKQLSLSSDSLSEFEKVTIQKNKIYSFKMVAPSFFGLLIMIFTVTYSRVTGDIEFFKIVSFAYLFVRLSQSLGNCYLVFTQLKLGIPVIIKIQHRLSEKYEPYDINKNTNNEHKTISGLETLSIKGLSHQYDDRVLFRDITLDLQRGDFLAVRGRSGTGKSTFVDLVMGLLRVQSGEILINSISISNLDLNNIIGYVGPTSFLIDASIKENLKYGNSNDITDEEMLEVLDYLNLKDKIISLKEGLNEPIDRQVSFSTGEKQRLEIARCLLRKPQLIIFDEALANLGAQIEDEILKMVKKNCHDGIVIAIGHKSDYSKYATQELRL